MKFATIFKFQPLQFSIYWGFKNCNILHAVNMYYVDDRSLQNCLVTPGCGRVPIGAPGDADAAARVAHGVQRQRASSVEVSTRYAFVITNMFWANQCIPGPDFYAQNGLHLPIASEGSESDYFTCRTLALPSSKELPVLGNFATYDRLYLRTSIVYMQYMFTAWRVFEACNKYYIVKAVTWKLFWNFVTDHRLCLQTSMLTCCSTSLRVWSIQKYAIGRAVTWKLLRILRRPAPFMIWFSSELLLFDLKKMSRPHTPVYVRIKSARKCR